MKKKLGFTSSSEQNSLEDRLTSLPESIRNHIISFLPIEDTVKLTILSTKWRNICSCLSYLEFDQSQFEDNTDLKEIDFRNLVDRLLINHDNSDVTKFSLSLRVDPEVITGLHINSWISFALKHNVQNLYLRLLSEKLDKLPCAFFTCCTLTTLCLCSMELQLPTVISFPNIKTLELACVKFPDERFTENFLPRCPVLESLSLIGCKFYFLKSFTISAPNLKLFVFRYNSIGMLEINLSAPNLQWMGYSGLFITNTTFGALNVSPETLHSLTGANIDMNNVLYPMSMVTKILMGLCKVTTLSLWGTTIELLNRDEALSACFPISCSSLTHLDLEMRPSKDHVKVVVLLLRSFPNLQTLHISFQINEESTNISSIKGYQLSQELSTGYLLTKLKTIEISYFALSNEYELHIVQYLLENSNILEKMNIKYVHSIRGSLQIRLSISDMLLTFAKASPRAAVTFTLSICTVSKVHIRRFVALDAKEAEMGVEKLV